MAQIKKERISLEREKQKKGKAETGKKGENHLKVGKTANGGKRRGWRVTERSGETKAEKGESRNGQKGQKLSKGGKKLKTEGNGEAAGQRIRKADKQKTQATKNKRKRKTATAT